MGKLSTNFTSAMFAKIGAGAVLLLGLTACFDFTPDPETDPTTTMPPETCYDYTGFVGATPTIKFSEQVLPILRMSCGVSPACHSSETGPVGQPYLGAASGSLTSTQIAAIFTQNVNAASKKAPTMKIVNPKNPQLSFMMHKLDGTLMCSDVKCGTGGCGVAMPQGGTMLSKDNRDVVRRWIAQGALNN